MTQTSSQHKTQGVGIDALLIQLARVEHVPYLRRLKETVMHDRYRPTTDEAAFEKWRETYCTDEYFQNKLADRNNKILVLGSLREPAGMVVLQREPENDYLEIDDLLVLEPRQGVGSRLLSSALTYAHAWRKRRVVVDIYPGHEQTERFLVHHGFERSGDAVNDLGEGMIRFERGVTEDD